jgi:hypothetical protein
VQGQNMVKNMFSFKILRFIVLLGLVEVMLNTLSASASPKLESKLPTGVYYSRGTMFNNSWREVKKRNGRICMMIVDGPANNYRGREEIIVSSVSVRNGNFYLDAINKKIAVYTGKEMRKLYEWVSEETQVAFTIDEGVPWEFRGSDNIPTASAESRKKLQECLNSKNKYVREFKGRKVRGVF